MSVKIYCDVCQKLIPNDIPNRVVPNRVVRRLGDVMIEVVVRYRGVWNAGHVCEACVIQVVNDGVPIGNASAARSQFEETQGRNEVK